MGAQLLFDMINAVSKRSAADLPASYRHVLIVLANFANDDNVAWPGKDTLAASTGISERLLYLMLPDLERAGWLTRTASVSGGNSISFIVRVDGGVISATRPGWARAAQRAVSANRADTANCAVLQTVQTPTANCADTYCKPCSSPTANRADDPPNGTTQLSTQGTTQFASASDDASHDIAHEGTFRLTVVDPGEPHPPAPPRKARKRPEAPEVDQGAYQRVVGAYFASYEAARGSKPIFGAIEGKAAKKLLEDTGGDVERAIEAITGAFADPFFVKSSASIRSIAAEPNRFFGRDKLAANGSVEPAWRRSMPPKQRGSPELLAQMQAHDWGNTPE